MLVWEPDGLDVPALTAGDVVVLVVSVEHDGSLTVVKGENESSRDDGDDGGLDIGREQFTVAGTITALGLGSG